MKSYQVLQSSTKDTLSIHCVVVEMLLVLFKVGPASVTSSQAGVVLVFLLKVEWTYPGNKLVLLAMSRHL